MRVSNSMIWGSVIYNTNSALSDYYALSAQNASKKKVNTPSDDPAGTGAILNLRDSLSAMAQYVENIGTAKGWLVQADDALTTMSERITNAKELAEQGATETMNASGRRNLAEELREVLAEMLTVVNTEYLDESIFAGQKTGANAYEECLGTDVTGGTLTDDDLLYVTGDSDSCILVEFLTTGTVGAAATGDIDYQYSTDGGETWATGTLAAGDTTLDLGGVQVEMADGAATSVEADAGGASTFVVRPSARYLGDDEDGADAVQYGDSDISCAAEGSFSGKVVVRVDTGGDIATDTIEYSYSTDGGSTWTTGNTSTNGILTVPGGTLRLTAGPLGGTTVADGGQFVITPHIADITLGISDSSSITINNVGKDIFGGLYQATGEAYATAEDGPNLFETVGELIGALETNDTEAISEGLEKLAECQSRVTSAAADVGARETRLEAAQTYLELRQTNSDSQLSDIEDVDLLTLSVKLEAAKTVYMSVVETSTNIMQLSLLKYL
ncbi:flagellin N-terminal helical domain-containing protein [Desulfocurvus sp. DL9XJH121]